MATVTITYTAISAPAADKAANICSTFVPTSAAADLAAFDGTYYDTNVAGVGAGYSIEKFFAGSVAHPGLIAALKGAIAKGSYEFETENKAMIMYLNEVKSALADQGFEIAVA